MRVDQEHDGLRIFDDVVAVDTTPVAARSAISLGVMIVVSVVGTSALVMLAMTYVWPWLRLLAYLGFPS